ncbi:hypothetical protein BDP27DRAFT_1446983 [Rhodocollybia butyracea]|uniref:DUF6533 domain-containing protein n=1 Tax=Rhodocollybia butyracea TaxID=206335 RepID=A0A9P5U928_9AGAR|nr:hypothetical protein BDP27DRAFT_1446983 [Rhodocollybia butyracea]
MSVSPITPEELLQFADGGNTVLYVLVSSAALFLYDWILMLPLELDVIWSEKLRPLSVLYVIQRYMPFVDTIALSFAGRVIAPYETYRTEYVSYPVQHHCMDVYYRDRPNRSHINDAHLGTLGKRSQINLWPHNILRGMQDTHLLPRTILPQYIPSPIPQIGCAILAGKSMFFLVFVIFMVYEAVILTLILIPALAYFRSGNWSALTTVVYRDGIIYYLFLFVFSVVNVVAILVLPNDLQVFFSPQRVMHTLLTSRVILHIRSQLRKPQTVLLREEAASFSLGDGPDRQRDPSIC